MKETNYSVRMILLGVLLAMLLAMLDNMVIGTAMPTIVRQLGGLDHLSWVVTAYTLTTAVSTPIWGKLGDLVNRKTVFLTAIVIFVAGSALSGAAQTMNELIAFRALQGIGAGGLVTGSTAIIGALVPPRERGRYQAMAGVVMAVGTIGGPLIGGFITEHFGWRWAFYINLPLGALAFGWSYLLMRLPKPSGRPRIDYLGAALLGVALTALVLVTTWGGTQYGWTSPRITGTATAGLLSLATFIWWELRVDEPIMPLHLFRSRNLTLAAVMIFVVGVAMFGGVSFLPLFQQSVQHASATNSGLLLLPMVVPIIVVSQVMGRLVTRTGRYKIFPVLSGLFLVAGSLLLATMSASTGRITTSVAMALFGTGLGFGMQMIMMIAQNSVDLKNIGVATATATLFRTIGGSFGVALFGALFTHQVAHAGPRAYLTGVSNGIDAIFWCCAALAAVGAVAAFFIKEVPLRGRAPSSAARTPVRNHDGLHQLEHSGVRDAVPVGG
jgi:EmrB/QacA subfamily drug resistance transporter